MTAARLLIEGPLHAAEALARGRVLGSSVTAEQPVLLYGAPLELAAIALGAHQHAGHALALDALDALALPVIRRRSGGSAVWAGQGVLYFALGLHDASALMACPAGKLLNRNVRGFLSGARNLGVPAHYFGRDFVSFATEPGAYVGWAEHVDGRALLEFFVALDTPFVLPTQLNGYPTPSEPALRGKTPTTLRNAGATQDAEAVLDALARGYARGFELELSTQAITGVELAAARAVRDQTRVDARDDRGLVWSSPHEEAIGFVSAGVRLGADRTIEALALAGDFMQHDSCEAALREALLGRAPDADVVGSALDLVYAKRPGLIEGIRSLQTLRAALLDAVARA